MRFIYGWSLLESLVAVFIAGTLSAYALPNMMQLASKYKANSALHDLRAAVNLARQTAITKNTNVVLCPRNNNRCGPRNSWHNGAIVFEDMDQNRTFSEADIAAGYLNAIQGGHIVWRSFRNRSYLLFRPSGLTDWQNGHFQYCPRNSQASLSRQLIVNYAGRTYPSKDANGDGVHEDARGRDLNCA